MSSTGPLPLCGLEVGFHGCLCGSSAFGATKAELLCRYLGSCKLSTENYRLPNADPIVSSIVKRCATPVAAVRASWFCGSATAHLCQDPASS